MILLLSSVVSLLLAFISFNLIKRLVKSFFSKQKEFESVVNRIRVKYYLLFLLVGIYFSIYIGDFSQNIEYISDVLFPVVIVVLIAYLVIRVFDGILYSILKEYAKKTETKLDDMLLPIVKNAVYLTAFLIVIIIILAKLGYDVSAFIAGLGVGGLALAMASQEILKNFFGGIVIMLDGTFKLGDRIKVKGYEGEVKEISLRATRITLEDGSIVNIPNSVVLKEAVVNLSTKKK